LTEDCSPAQEHNEIVANHPLLRYTQRDEGLSMRNYFALSLLLFTSTFVALDNQTVVADDTGKRYSDAFILAQQGATAEKKSDTPEAYQKYSAALEILRSIRTDTPDWKPQMVEFRLKDVTARVEATKPKAPEDTTAAPTVETPVATTTAPELSVEKSDASASLEAELQHAQEENRRLSAELEQSRKVAAAPKASPEIESLSKENRQLNEQLASSQREVADLQKQTKDLSAQLVTAQKQAAKSVVAAAPTESADVKALRAELDQAKKTAARVPELEKQNKDLSAQLASAQRHTAATAASAPSAAGPKQNFGPTLHNEPLEGDATKKLKEQVTVLQKQNKDLSAQLADARAQADSAKKAGTRVAELEKANKDLTAQLAAAQKQVSAKTVAPAAPSESAELKKLRTELSESQAELARAKKTAVAASAEQRAVPAPAESSDARIMKQLRRENSYLRNLLEQYVEKNPELKPRLRNLDQGAAPSGN
jgi:predicted nuclease with TOPRIM domain